MDGFSTVAVSRTVNVIYYLNNCSDWTVFKEHLLNDLYLFLILMTTVWWFSYSQWYWCGVSTWSLELTPEHSGWSTGKCASSDWVIATCSCQNNWCSNYWEFNTSLPLRVKFKPVMWLSHFHGDSCDSGYHHKCGNLWLNEQLSPLLKGHHPLQMPLSKAVSDLVCECGRVWLCRLGLHLGCCCKQD